MPLNYSFTDWTCSTWSNPDFDHTGLWLTPSTTRILREWWPMGTTDWSLGPGVQEEKVRGVNIHRCNGWVGWRGAGKKMWRTQKKCQWLLHIVFVIYLYVCFPKMQFNMRHTSHSFQSSRCATQRVFQPSQKCIFTWMRHIIPPQTHI